MNTKSDSIMSTKARQQLRERQEMKEKLRAVGYCRTSGEGQRDNSSIPIQEKSIEDFSHRNDWKFISHYVDESKTGSKVAGRDAFQP